MSPLNHTAEPLIPDVCLIAPIRTVAYDLEKYLIHHTENSNISGITHTLALLTGYIEDTDRTSLSEIRSRIYEQCSVLIRVCIENGISTKDMESIHHTAAACEQLFDAPSLYRLSRQLNAAFIQFSQQLPQLRAGIQTVCKSKGYIARNYTSRITLDEIAGYVHLNASYFSSVFRKNAGVSFREYLNRYRVRRSCQLLKTTRYPIIDIAISSGFDDQCYFTKIFKKYAGTTPAYYRYSEDSQNLSL